MRIASLIQQFNARVSWPLRAVLVLGAGLLFYTAGLLLLRAQALSVPVLMTGHAVLSKLRGRAPDCPWPRVISIYPDTFRQAHLAARALPTLAIRQSEEALDIQLIASPARPFWIKRRGANMDGQQLLAYLLSEHDRMAEDKATYPVQKGDVVLDCGAHVGVFTNKALQLGAGKVIAIEPDPVNVECFRRNFAAEIAAGRVVVVPQGVWSAPKTITLFFGLGNSGMNSMVARPGAGSIEVPVTTIDNIVQTLILPRVDYIKMDIEGAEREALAGAMETLKKFRPRLMLDSYHRPDDMQVLPVILRRAHPDYNLSCGPCEPSNYDRTRLVPHMTFYR